MVLSGFFLYGQDTITLNTFEVIGVRAAEKAPISKLTLKKNEIQTFYYSQELPLLLDKTPNITTSTDGGHNQGYVYFRLRGIDQTRINMTLNGIPLNEPEDQGVYFSNYPDFTTSLESMQIQRGVGTSSNGVASYGGSINFEAKQGLEGGSELQLGYGSFRTHRISAEVSTGMFGKNKKTAFYSRVSQFSTNGYKYHSGSNGMSFFLHGGHYGEKNILKTIIFTGYSINRLAWFGVPREDIEDDPRTNYNTDREYDHFTQSLVSLIYTRKINNKSNITSTIYYNRLDGNWDLDLIDSLKNYQLAHNFYGFISNFNYINDNLNLDFGVHINGYNRDHSSTISNSTDKLYTNTGYKNDISSFLKVEYKISNLLFFGDAQLRYTKFRYSGDMEMTNMEWIFLNPKVGFTYLINKKTNVYASVGVTGREPTRSDIFYGEDDPSFNYLGYNKNIKAESVTDYEVGTNFKNKNFVIQGNFYYMNFKNELTHLGLFGENSLPIMVNVEKSFRSGVELNFNWILYRNGDALIKYINNSSYSYNEITDDGRKFSPLYTPNFITNNIIHFENKDVYISLEHRYQSESYIDWENNHSVGSYYTLNVNCGYTFYKNFSFNFRMNNITDQEYFTNGYVENGVDYLYINPPFNWFVTLKIIIN